MLHSHPIGPTSGPCGSPVTCWFSTAWCQFAFPPKFSSVWTFRSRSLRYFQHPLSAPPAHPNRTTCLQTNGTRIDFTGYIFSQWLQFTEIWRSSVWRPQGVCNLLRVTERGRRRARCPISSRGRECLQGLIHLRLCVDVKSGHRVSPCSNLLCKKTQLVQQANACADRRRDIPLTDPYTVQVPLFYPKAFGCHLPLVVSSPTECNGEGMQESDLLHSAVLCTTLEALCSRLAHKGDTE